VVNIPLDGIGTICRQRSVGRFSLVIEIVERLVEGTGRIRRVVSAGTAVDLVSGGQAGVVAPKAAPRVAEHSRPAVTRRLGHPELYAVVISDRLRVIRARGTGAEVVVGVERGYARAVGCAQRSQKISIPVDGLVYALAGVDDGVDFERFRIGQRSILDDVVETATVIAGFKCPIPRELVVHTSNVLVLPIRLHPRCYRL